MDPNAQVDQRRQDKEPNAPALGQNPQPVRRTSGLTVGDVLAFIDARRDAREADFNQALRNGDHKWMQLSANMLMGIDDCRKAIVELFESQSS